LRFGFVAQTAWANCWSGSASNAVGCPFLQFEVVWPQAGGAPWLNLRGPPGTRDFLKEEMPELPHE
jgi:hypothetical protein